MRNIQTSGPTELSLGITIIAIAVGIIMLWRVGVAMKKKQISDYQGLFWIIAGLLIIILGAYPGLVGALADLFGIWWPPAVLLFADAVLIGFLIFSHSKEISVLKEQIMELSEQVSILKAEKNKEAVQNEELISEHPDLREEHSVH